LDEFAAIFMLINTSELRPYFSVPKALKNSLLGEMFEANLPINVNEAQFFDYELLNKFFTAKVFYEWVNECSEKELLKNYAIQPGIFHSKLYALDWVCYAAAELARLLKKKELTAQLLKLRHRLKYGIREELIELTYLEGIGRVRARKLYNAGIKSISQLKKADVQDIARIIGEKLATKIKEKLCREK